MGDPKTRPGNIETRCDQKQAFIARLRQSPIAVLTDAANKQHYELPPEFFGLVLGKHRKYSCCLYSDGTEGLNDAEEKMLDLTCERARLKDGMDILGENLGSNLQNSGKIFPFRDSILSLS